MKLHPTNVTLTSGEMLGVQIMQMRYDKVLEVLDGMRKEAQDQAFCDWMNSRDKLSAQLTELEGMFEIAIWHIEKNILPICQRHIDAEKSFLESQS
jgi:hypothetical protein